LGGFERISLKNTRKKERNLDSDDNDKKIGKGQAERQYVLMERRVGIYRARSDAKTNSLTEKSGPVHEKPSKETDTQTG